MVVCPPPTKYLAVVAFRFGGHLYTYSLQQWIFGQLSQPTAKHLAVVAFEFGGHLYPYSLQTASEAVNKQLTVSKFLIFHT